MIECRWMSVGIHTNSLFSWYNIQSLYRNLASGWWVSWKIIRYWWWLVMFFSSSAASLTWSFERRFINPNSLRYSVTNIYSVLIPICVKFDSYVDTYRWIWFWVFMLCLLGNTPMMSVGIHSQPAILGWWWCVFFFFFERTSDDDTFWYWFLSVEFDSYVKSYGERRLCVLVLFASSRVFLMSSSLWWFWLRFHIGMRISRGPH